MHQSRTIERQDSVKQVVRIADDYAAIRKRLEEMRAPPAGAQHEFSSNETTGDRRCLRCRLPEYHLSPCAPCDTSMP
jgi:hypothetical protein